MTLIPPHIERLVSYETGEQPPAGSRTIKLNQNECPYPPSPRVIEALRSLGEEELRVYPDGLSGELRAALAERHGLSPKQAFIGNGSSEIISLLFKLFAAPGAKVAIPDPSFSLYGTQAALQRASCSWIPTDERFMIDPGQLAASGADMLVLINPNAPTGLQLPALGIERMLERFDGLIIVDEAYIDFADPGHSAIPLVTRYPNLVVLRTFSKSYALCGARVGCCFADERLIAALDKGRDIYNVNAVSQKLALAALRDDDYMRSAAAAVCRTRDAFSIEIRRLGFTVAPSQTNFVLCTPPQGPNTQSARQIYEQLLERNIYVRHFEHPRLADKLRISIGTDADMAAVIDALRGILARSAAIL